jgi:hypothetical protein
VPFDLDRAIREYGREAIDSYERFRDAEWDRDPLEDRKAELEREHLEDLRHESPGLGVSYW